MTGRDTDGAGRDRYGRRQFLGLGARALGGAALLGAAPAWLTACSSGSGGRVGPATAPTGKPRYGGSLNVGIGAETNGLDPAASDFTAPAVYYARAVFDPLTIQSADGSVKPYLAQSVVPNSSYDVWTINLRPGVAFHDGTPLNADAMVAYFERVIASPTYSITLQKLIKSVTKTGDMSVALQMGQPWVAFDAYLSGGTGGAAQMGFVPAPAMQTETDGIHHPVGTGPFMFSHWETNVSFVVKRNPNYWRKGLPYLDTITFKPVPDETARLQTLQSGGVDLIHTGDYATIHNLQGQRSLSVLTNLHGHVGEPSQNFIMLNTQVAPLDDLRVRQALAYATDQAKLIQLTEFGLVAPSTGPFEPGSPWYAPTGYPSYDQSKARSLVDAYTADKGPISFPIITAGTSDLNKLQVLQSMWKQVGITVTTINSETSTAQIGDILVGRYSAASWGQFSAPDPDMNYPFWSATTVAPLGTFAVNFARNADPQLEAALQVGRTNPDASARIKAYQQVATRLGADVPYIWTGRAVGAVASKPGVTGYEGGVGLPGGGRSVALDGSNVWLTETWLS